MNTYDKKMVLEAANKTAQTMRAERRARLTEWDSKSGIARFFLGLFGAFRPDYHGVGQQKTAERVSFKASFCTEQTISLSDDDIDAIRDYWGVAE